MTTTHDESTPHRWFDMRAAGRQRCFDCGEERDIPTVFVPATSLHDVLDELQRRIRAALKLHEAYRPAHIDEHDICVECSVGEHYIPWPCATRRALDGE